MTISHPSLNSRSLSLDISSLSTILSERENILIIQDLDGVCMGLVKDPLTRTISREYLEAARSFGDRFFVLTNGEHIGKRGVNGIIDRTLGSSYQAQQQGLYLHGLGGGGVQWQDSQGHVSHPGVSDAEMAFLEAVPLKMANFLKEFANQPKCGLSSQQQEQYIKAAVLDNKVSPTANLNIFYEAFANSPQLYAELQQQTQSLMNDLLQEAAAQGLADSFFVHYAPNLGRDEESKEVMQPSKANDSGTTDFQFMLRGAIKEVGVLVILNHYYFVQTGTYPLGKDFNARQAPQQQAELIQLAINNFAPQLMPTLVGIGDTVTSKAVENGERLEFKRGGSDRGFLELIQALGQKFATDNAIVYVDSSGGEVKNRQALEVDRSNPSYPQVISGVGDPRDEEDPLKLNFVFPGGHEDYVNFFCQVARQRSI